MMPAALITLSTIQSNPVNLSGGLGIALVGMTTVFFGLIVLAFMLPALENWVENRFGLNRKNRTSPAQEDTSITLTPEEVAAVATAVHAHFCLLDQVENMKLTWESHEKPYTPWRLAAKAELLQGSGKLQNRVRSR